MNEQKLVHASEISPGHRCCFQCLLGSIVVLVKVGFDELFALMPPAASYRFIVQARCSLSAWPEWRALRAENTCILSAFIFDILC
jgi:hypothetical protein